MKNKIAIIGSGPTCLYILKQLSDQSTLFKSHIQSISIFEKSKNAGMGMPYNPETTDIHNLSNISSEEIPLLEESFADWLKDQSNETLKNLNITEFPINKSKVYSRLALGNYLKVQFDKIVKKLDDQGITVKIFLGVKIVDIVPNKNSELVKLFTSNSERYDGFNKVIISTGHIWADEDKPKKGYYASPWPIHKILPDKNSYYNFAIGTLGASLSAFDVVTSLAHRHGNFHKSDQGLTFELNKNAKHFKLVMHSAEGWLPHLQYEQEKPIREIYRHTSRDEILGLIDASGFLSLSAFFDTICRPALLEASIKDGDPKLTDLLCQQNFGIKEFIDHMEGKHEYVNSFEGMRKELAQAKEKLELDKPTHWMETLDDLMYCLNFHAEVISAEDHLFFRRNLMPFLMNVIAALPLSSARTLLALYDAGCITLMKGRVEIIDDPSKDGKTIINVSNAGEKTKTISYNMFINCSGQGNIKFEDYPFPTLLKDNFVRKARAKFKSAPDHSFLNSAIKKKNILMTENESYVYTGGIDIDAGYRIIDSYGNPDSRIHDVSFVHTAGCRPYSYGLQACNATSVILVEQLKSDLNLILPINQDSIEDITKIYEDHEDL